MDEKSKPGTYRADIDGMRAIAVGSVIAFHAFPTLLPGGFVGVDIFFVISGYLITGILFTELRDKGVISLIGFVGSMPSSSRLANRHRPVPSQNTSLIRSARLARNT
jgi:peptidoglycan/LPS O-acetylase OafA/YrhL